jgi:hypothetical protein
VPDVTASSVKVVPLTGVEFNGVELSPPEAVPR